MSYLSRLFSKPVVRTFPGIGEFEYYKAWGAEYWQVETSVLALPNKFDFGAISGTKEGPIQKP